MVNESTRRRRRAARDAYELDRPAGLVQPCLACDTRHPAGRMPMGYCQECWTPDMEMTPDRRTPERVTGRRGGLRTREIK